jgi:hypothetical protein
MAIQYTLDDVERIFGVTYTAEQRAALQDVQFSDDVLRACAGTHMLFPGFPLSLLDVRATFADLFFSKTGGWYAEEKQSFSRASVPVRWHLLRTTPVPDSFSRTWSGQYTLLLPDEEVPSAATVAFATMLHFKATGQRLFESCYVRTSNVDADGNRVIVGGFDAVGFSVSDVYWDHDRRARLGLSSVRKF